MRSTGKVKWYNETKGYGFITPENGSKDLYVHSSSIQPGTRTLSEGDRVEFTVVEAQRGPAATDVTLL